MSIGIYIHIPFCRQKCLYCDFPSFANLDNLFALYTDALCREISEQGVLFLNENVDTVYIGGGTPTILPVNYLEKIINTLTETFSITEEAEVSIEANPGTVDKNILQRLRNLGINRISFGVQSFHNEILLRLGRIHTGAEGTAAVEDAQWAGFNNINVDLMFGLPGQSHSQFEKDLQTAVALGVQHISAYGLKIEEGTPFARMHMRNELELPPEESEAAMYELVVNYLPSRGFERYEISNYAQAASYCRHNLKYWHYEPYLGLGSAAHSFNAGERWANDGDVKQYIKMISSGLSPICFKEAVDSLTAMAEFIFLGLRTTRGVNIQQFNDYFGISLLKHYEEVLEQLTKQNLLRCGNGYIYLTATGMRFGNMVFEKFLPD